MKRHVPVLVLLLVLSAFAAADVLMGTNLYGVNDYSPQIPFANALKQARPFVSAGRYGGADGRVLDVDADGYPVALLDGQTAVSYLFTTLTHHPVGEYRFEYDGTGTVAFQQAGKLLPNGNVEISTGTVVIRITSTPVSNLRLWLPDHGPDELFNRQFLEAVRPYHVLRFMNWQHINSTWGQTETRPAWGDLTDYTWADSQGGGVPISVCLALCDAIGARPWFCIHHLADDDYMRRLFHAVEDWRPCYWEWSNEIWNGQYRQSGYAGEQGVAFKLADTAWPAKLHFQADRTRRMKELSAGRGTIVIASQAANAWVGKTLLERINPTGDDTLIDVPAPANAADALAIAPYFTCENPTPERLSTVAIPESLGWIEKNKAVADAYGVPLIFYECGQHIVRFSTRTTVEIDDTVTAVLIKSVSGMPSIPFGATLDDEPVIVLGYSGNCVQLSRSAPVKHKANALLLPVDTLQDTTDMEALYHQYFDGCRALLPDGVFCHFVDVSPYGAYGDWGVTDNIYHLATAKRRAVVAYCGSKSQGQWLKRAGIALRQGQMAEAGAALMQAGGAE